MPYYNRNWKKLELYTNNMKLLDSGACAKVSHNGKIILKEYFTNTETVLRLSPKMFDILKSINNPHFIQIFDIYKNTTLPNYVISKLGMQRFITDAYTAKYYPDDNVNLLYANTDYLLDNFRELEALFDMFSDSKIITADIKRANCILNNNGIIIIDPDAFRTIDTPKSYIIKNNKENLLLLLRNILWNAANNLSEEENHNYLHPKIIDTIFNKHINVTEETDVTYELSKKLKHVKRPIDYFIK